jgi:nucleoid-associated protein YgaU
LTALTIVVMIGPIAFAGSGGRRSHLPIEVASRGPTSVIVQPGDHLWGLSEKSLFARWGRQPSEFEVWPYWRTVISTNRDHLRSGDPDLIFPGEEVLLPAPD